MAIKLTQQLSPGSAKVLLILGVVVALGITAVGAGAVLLYLNRDKLGLTAKTEAPHPSRTSDGPSSTMTVSTSSAPARRPVVSSTPIQANERSYASYVGRDDVLVMVDYYADWCGPCRTIAPHLSRLAARHGDKVVVLKVNVDREKPLAARAGVRGIPDVRLLHRGQQLERFVGGRPFESYEGSVLKHASRLPAPTGPTGSSSAPPRSASEPAITPLKKDWLPPGVQPVN